MLKIDRFCMRNTTRFKVKWMEQNIRHSERFPFIVKILHVKEWYVNQGLTRDTESVEIYTKRFIASNWLNWLWWLAGQFRNPQGRPSGKIAGTLRLQSAGEISSSGKPQSALQSLHLTESGPPRLSRIISLM